MSTATKALALDETLQRVATALEGGSTPISTRLENIDSSIAEIFDSTESYSVGECVMYQDKLYKCTTAHSGSWDATHFTATTATTEGGGGGGLNVAGNAGAHNAIYRGQSLGTSVSSAQFSAISAGTFDDMFIGDYWTIGNVVYRIAGFDYWLHCGDTECTDHHVVLVPDTCLYNAVMNDSNVTTGGYVGSKMYTSGLADAKSTINTAFGSSHVLSHRELLSNAVSSDIASNWSWYDSTVELMSEVMVYGCNNGAKPVAGSINFNIGIDKSQLPLFALEPSRITNRAGWWLRDVVSSADFADVATHGYADNGNASVSLGVRPAFAIC
jgi:hypothetical protein